MAIEHLSVLTVEKNSIKSSQPPKLHSNFKAGGNLTISCLVRTQTMYSSNLQEKQLLVTGPENTRFILSPPHHSQSQFRGMPDRKFYLVKSYLFNLLLIGTTALSCLPPLTLHP
jgi:hypothetical protein